jgi:hypothetical protein
VCLDIHDRLPEDQWNDICTIPGGTSLHQPAPKVSTLYHIVIFYSILFITHTHIQIYIYIYIYICMYCFFCCSFFHVLLESLSSGACLSWLWVANPLCWWSLCTRFGWTQKSLWYLASVERRWAWCKVWSQVLGDDLSWYVVHSFSLFFSVLSFFSIFVLPFLCYYTYTYYYNYYNYYYYYYYFKSMSRSWCGRPSTYWCTFEFFQLGPLVCYSKIFSRSSQ